MSDMEKMLENGKFELTDETIPILYQMSELLPGGFFIYCASGYREILFANSVMVRIMGCDNPEDFLDYTGKSFKGLVIREDYEAVDRAVTIQARDKKQTPDPIEYKIRTKQGDIRWIQHFGRMVETKRYGKIYVVFTYDVTEKTLKVQENRRKAEVIHGLSREYNSIYLIDFDTHQMIPYSTNNGVARSMRYAFNNVLDYETTIQEFADTYVLPEEYDRYMYETSVERIRERIMGEQSYTVAFRRYNEKHVPELVHMTISRVEDKNRFNRIVMSYKTVGEG